MVRLVVAVGADGTIGSGGGLPWRLPADLAHFKQVTWGHPIIMGRKTFESIGRPLPGRSNIVISSQGQWRSDGVTVAANLAESMRAAEAIGSEAYIIGGAQIYAQALEQDRCDELIISHVHAAPGGDTVFAHVDWNQWRETHRVRHPDSSPPFDIVTYRRVADVSAQPEIG